MNTFKNLLNNNKKFVYLIISVLVIAVIIIVAVLVNITNKGGRDTSDTAGATIESRTDSQVLTESTIDKSNINKNGDNIETVSADNESTENNGNDIAQEDATEVSKETSQEQYISSDNGGSDDEEGVAADDNNVNQGASSGHIVYNADGSLNLQESYWESYKGWKEFQNAIGSNSQFQQLISKA